MRAKANWTPALLLVLLVGAGAAWSADVVGGPESGQPPQRGPGMWGMRGGPDLQEELGLSEEQMSQLRALRFQAAKSGLRTRSEVRLKRLELEELMESEEPDQVAIEKTLREIADGQHALLKQRIERRLAMRRVLTPEQHQKWQKLRRQFWRRQMRRGPFRGLRGLGRHGPRSGGGFGPGRFGPGGLGPGKRFGPGGGFGPGLDLGDDPPLPQ